MPRDEKVSFVDDKEVVYVASEPPTWRDIWKIIRGRYQNQVIRVNDGGYERRIRDENEELLSALLTSEYRGKIKLTQHQSGEHPAITAIKEGLAERPRYYSKPMFDDLDVSVEIVDFNKRPLL